MVSTGARVMMATLGGLMALAPAAEGQSLLDRPPNLTGSWVVRPGTVQFNFLHRFIASDEPERKVSSFPTFLIGTGVFDRLMVGFHYATNSTLAPSYPNEWEFFGRYQLFAEDAGKPLDLAGQLGYNLAAEGVDGELSAARRLGPVRLLAAGRYLSNPIEDGEARIALAGGASVRLTSHLALAGDVATILEEEGDPETDIAWGAGLQIAIPNTPHTLSLQATNTNTATLQGISRGGDDVRYGFEFTIPITLARYFGRRPQPDPGRPTMDPAAIAPDSADPAAARPETMAIRNMGFARGRLEVPAGTTVVWTNADPLVHTVTANDKSFDSGPIEPGKSYRRTFTQPGTYTYFCTPHPFMQGTVVVR